MSRLYDRIMRDAKYWLDEDIVVLQQAEVIYASGMHAYLQSLENDGKKQDMDLFPCIAPPFNIFFVETRLNWGAREKDINHEYGVLFQTLPMDDIDTTFPLVADQAKWLISGSLYFPAYQTRGFFCDYFWLLDNFGTPLNMASNGNTVKVTTVPYENSFFEDIVKRKDWETVGMIRDIVTTLAYPVMMALALINCKNVELIEEVPPPKLSKKHEEKYGVPMVKYKTLKVNSMRREYADDDRESQPGIPKSLHICRGHFKDYRNGGLFGKLEGIYWWDSHIRGSAKRGVTIKDYDVQAPRT